MAGGRERRRSPMNVPTVPVSFVNQNGHRLSGILHRPEQPRPTAILLLSPGVKMRVAPHRLYMRMAEEFAALGYLVLRFDFEGLGDSEGEVRESLLTDLYGTIQVGRYVSDTIAAMDWVEAEHGLRSFVVAGLCGGAITGLLAAERDPRIVSLLGLAIPVIVEGSRQDRMQYMTTGELQGIRKGYFAKLNLSGSGGWQALWRFVTFQSHYRLMWRSLTAPLARLLNGTADPSAGGAASSDDNTNPHFAPALFRMLATSRPVLLIFAGSDRLHWEFEEKFVSRHREELAAHRGCTIHVTPLANHIFSLPEWQDDMMGLCRRWLLEQAGAAERSGYPG
jgi:pimeloyl-ACP methyl ester carboxylesterase